MATRVSFADPPVVRRLAAPVLQPPMNPAASFVQNKLQQAPFFIPSPHRLPEGLLSPLWRPESPMRLYRRRFAR